MAASEHVAVIESSKEVIHRGAVNAQGGLNSVMIPHSVEPLNFARTMVPRYFFMKDSLRDREEPGVASSKGELSMRFWVLGFLRGDSSFSISSWSRGFGKSVLAALTLFESAPEVVR